MKDITIRVEVRDGEGHHADRVVESWLSYETQTHHVLIGGTVFPKDLALFNFLVDTVKRFEKKGLLPFQDQG